MTTLIQIVTAIALVLSIIVPFGYFFLGEKNKARYTRTVKANCFFFFGTARRLIRTELRANTKSFIRYAISTKHIFS